MRRTMHAAAILLACASQLQAQSPSDKKFTEGTRSTAVRSENATTSRASTTESIPLPTTSPSSELNYIRGDSGRPYSQLATVMQCNDWRPNLWDNYASERAALASRISQHVDMQCKCFDCKSNLYSTACEPGCGGCESGQCQAGSAAKPRNRYKESFSTLFSTASDSCGTNCGTSCSSRGRAPCPPSPCGQETQQLQPISAIPPSSSSSASRERFAAPVVNFPRSATNTPSRPLLFEPTR
jgi:hypothetical protein